MTPVSFLLAAFISSTLFAQSTDSFDWFPYKTGDMWEYRVWDGLNYDTLQIFNIRDSVAADGTIHLTQLRQRINPISFEALNNFTIDTGAAEVFGPWLLGGDSALLFRFDSRVGDKWVVVHEFPTRYEIARVEDIYEGVLFGRNTTFMQIRYYSPVDSTDTIGMSRAVITLAKGFGLFEFFPSESGDWYRIKGAVIDGVLFGDTTTLVTSVDTQPANGAQKNFELKQNYPNPFTSHTLIRFSLPRKEYVSLTIHDVIGRVVRTLIPDHEFSGGEHFLFWNGRDDKGEQVPHGMYIIHLRGNGYTLKRKAIVINE